MATWNELFPEEKHRELIPETVVYRFRGIVEGADDERVLKYHNLGIGVCRDSESAPTFFVGWVKRIK